MALTNRIIKNSIALLSSQAFHSLVSICAIAIIARYLGIERFGEYGFVLAICNIFQVMTDMGANQVFIREVAREPAKVNEYFTASVLIMSIFGTLVFILILGTVYFFRPPTHILLAAAIGALAVIMLFVSQLFSAVFQAYEKMGYVAIMRPLGYSFYLFFVIVAVIFDWGIVGIFMALLIQNISACIAGYGLIRKNFFKPQFSLNRSILWKVFREGWPIGVNAMLRKASYRVDILFLKALSSSADLGLFNGIYRIILQLQFIPRNVTSALFPVFSRLSKGEEELFAKVHYRAVKLLLIGTVPLLAGLLISSRELISIVLGNEFLEAVPLMRVLIVCLGLLFFNILLIRTLNAANEQRWATFSVAVALGFNILCDMLFIPRWGYMGAGFATLIAETVLFCLTAFFVYSRLPLTPFFSEVPKLIMSGTVMVGLWILFKGQNKLAMILLGAFVYFAMLWILRMFKVFYLISGKLWPQGPMANYSQ